MELRELERQVDLFLKDQEDYLHMVIFAVNSAYLVLIVFMGIGIVPVFVYFRN